MDNGGILGKVYLCNDIINEPEKTIQLNTLSYILFENPESPFYYDYLHDLKASGFCPGNIKFNIYIYLFIFIKFNICIYIFI